MEVTHAWQVIGAIHAYIATHKDPDGHLDIEDDKTGETLPLKFVEIDQPVRHLEKKALLCSPPTSASTDDATNTTTSISG